MGGFCLLVELHREGSAPAACAAGLFFRMFSSNQTIFLLHIHFFSLSLYKYIVETLQMFCLIFLYSLFSSSPTKTHHGIPITYSKVSIDIFFNSLLVLFYYHFFLITMHCWKAILKSKETVCWSVSLVEDLESRAHLLPSFLINFKSSFLMLGSHFCGK